MGFLKKENGFTLLEMAFVIAILAIVTMISVTNISNLSDGNAATVMKQNSSNVLDYSKSYLLSTAIPKSDELEKEIIRILSSDGYTKSSSDERNFKVSFEKISPASSKQWVIRLHHKIDSTFSLKATVMPEKEVICVEAITSDSERKNAILEEGKIDNGSKCR